MTNIVCVTSATLEVQEILMFLFKTKLIAMTTMKSYYLESNKKEKLTN